MGLVLDRQSVWGKKILEKQAANQPPASMNFGSIVDREIYKQKRQPSPTLAWQVDGARVHPLLAEVGVRPRPARTLPATLEPQGGAVNSRYVARVRTTV